MEQDLCRLLFENSTAAMAIVQLDSFVLVTPGTAQLLGCNRDELLGKNLLDFSPATQPDGVSSEQRLAEMFEAAACGKPQKFEWLCLPQNGRPLPIEIQLDALPVDGQPLYQLVLVDISSFKMTEVSLKDSQRRLADLIDFLPDATFAINTEGQVIAWNQAMEQLSGLAAKNVLGQGDYIYAMPFYGERRPILANLALKPDEEIAKNYPTLERDGDSFVTEVATPFLTRTGDAVVWAKASRLYNATGQLVGAIESVRDISGRKQLEQQVQESFARRGRQLQLAAYLAQESASMPDLSELYQRLITRIKEQFDFSHAQLFHYNQQENRLDLTVGYGAVGRQMQAEGYTVPVGEGLVGLAAACSAVVFCPDVSAMPEWRAHPLLPETRGEMAIPVTVGSEYAPAQAQALEAFIKHKYDGLIVTAIDLAAAGQVTRQAIERGQTVVAFGADLGAENQSLFVEYSNYEVGFQLGQQAGEWAKAHIAPNETLNLAMLTLSKEQAYVGSRETGMLDGLTDVYGGKFSVVATATAGSRVRGRLAAEKWLKELPQLRMILSINDAGAVGAYEVVAATQRYTPDDFFIGGIDAIDEALTAIKAGTIYQATVTNSPVEMGALLVRAAARILKGVPHPQVRTMYHVPINCANIDEFLDERGWLVEPPLPHDEVLDGLDCAGMTLGLSVLNLDNPYFSALARTAQAEAERLKMRLVVSDPKRVLGIISVHSNTPNMLTKEDQLVLAGIAGQLTVTIENTRLLEEANAFRQFTEAAGQGLGMARLDGSAVYMNPKMLQMLDVNNLSAVIGRSLVNNYPAQTRKFITEVAIPTALKKGQWVGELDLQSTAGKRIPTIHNIFLIRDDDGNPLYIAIAITDISEQKRTAAELQARLEELAALQGLMSREGWQSYQGNRQDVLGYQFVAEEVLPLEQPNGAGGQALVKPVLLHGEIIAALGVENDPDDPLTAQDEEFLNSVAEQVAEALERARLLEQTHKRAAELETVAQAGAVVSSVHDVDELLQTVVDLTKSQFGLYHAHVYLLNQAGDTLTLAAGAGDVGRQMVRQGWQIALDREDSIVAQAARTKKGIIANDVRQSPNFLSNPLLPDTRSELAVPLLSGEAVLGVLDVQADATNRFSSEDIHIQTTLASQVSVALQNAGLYHETQTALTEIERSRALLQAIINTLPDWILVKDHDLRFQLVNHSFADTFGKTPQDFVGKHHLKVGLPEELVNGNPDRGVRGLWADDMEVLKTGQTKVIEAELSVVNGQDRFLSMVKTPLRTADGHVTGVLAFVRDVTNRENNLRDIERQARQLAMLNQLAISVNDAAGEDEIYRVVAEQILEIVGGNKANIAMLTPEGDQFELFNLSRLEGSVATGTFLPLQGTGVGQVLQARYVMAWSGDNGSQYKDIEQIRNSGISSLVSAPLVSGDKVIGVLTVGSFQPDFFGSFEEYLLLQIASTLATNLENRRLLQETQSSLQETTTLYRVTRGLAHEHELSEMFQLVLAEYLHHLNLKQGGVLIFNELKTYGTLMAVTIDGKPAEPGLQIPVAGNPATQQLLLTKKPVAITDARTDPLLEPVRGLTVELGYRSMLLAPIVVRGEVIGALGADSTTAVKRFTEREIALMQSVGDQLGVAIERQRLLAETRRALEEVERTQRRYTVQAWKKYQIENKPQRYEHVREDVSLSADKPRAAPDANLVVPLKMRNEVIGVLGLQDAGNRTWAPEEIELVEAIAEQMAQAAENLRLLDETQSRAAREQFARQVTDKIRASRDIESALKVAAQELSQVLGVGKAEINLQVSPASPARPAENDNPLSRE